MTNDELLVLIKEISKLARQGDACLIEHIDKISHKITDTILVLNDKVVDLDERIHQLESRIK